MASMTYEQAVAEFSEICAEQPDFRYEGPDEGDCNCLYVHTAADGSLVAGCLIGVWLHRFHQVPLERLRDLECNGVWTVIDTLAETGALPWQVSRELEDGRKLRAFLGAIQHANDHGQRWAEALVWAQQHAVPVAV